jgi:hypothetical protein
MISANQSSYMRMKRSEHTQGGLTEAAKRKRAVFQEKYKAFMKNSRQTALTILVWGPNPQSDSPVANKRKEIVKELLKLGHHAAFSEEINGAEDGLSEKSKEFAQAHGADLIIILVEDAPGALAEAHDFCNVPKLAPNIYVMIPQKYKGGYSAQGAIKDLSDGYGGVYWYEDNELKICNILERAVRRAEARRQILFRAGGAPL